MMDPRPEDVLLAFRLLSHHRSSRAAVLSFRDALVRRLAARAASGVPFYEGLFRAAGVRAGDIRGASDLTALPLVSKGDYTDREPAEVLARGTDPRRLRITTTTGSTGEPFVIRRSPTDELFYFVLRLRAMRAFGLKPGDLMARISVYGREGMPQPWRLAQRAGLFRAMPIHILEAPGRIAERVRAGRPRVLTGDSGVLARVSREFGPDRPAPSSLRFIVSGSEVLTANMRHHIETGFGRPVYDTYASEEFSVLAWECPATGLYHVSDDGIVLEVLRDGRPVGPGETGEAVVTGLLSRAMPFIRYRLGDEVTRGPEPCPCGLPFSTLSRIRGRMTDYLRLPGGREIYAASMAYVFQKRLDWIRQYEMEQAREDDVTLRAVCRGVPPPEALSSLERDIAGLLGPGVRFRVELVDELNPGPRGKFRILRSHVGSFYERPDRTSPGGRGPSPGRASRGPGLLSGPRP
jgi:phenylacetate-CoA ligase